MYEIFEKLIKMHNVTAYKVSKDTNIPYSAFSDWKAGRSTPKQDKLKKIADYLGVSIEYLMTGEENSDNKFVLENTYFSFAKEAQEKNISKEDMKKMWQFYEMIKNK
ncbi:MAG TPA: hypothetical protein DHW61_15630 [Lachnoclostridium phytofermentans]|uniref:HTH cro/C1-type domain-containing protein n=1 Tax=Lachnoclostridium phytofermentans TaxID=66219 RepID=A0A3D2X9L9_9FIRM|nr:helix-turn-helix transcriptional regulator [Lachnoclostridium sp.]HCL03811.1 hypothetical protein [Lachnoclostridium phytofermentans]